jgi:uncharacterized membrane protein YgdD (TMEM256/DUF423 family)
MSKLFLVLGAASMALAVALGAFGAHGLKQKLSPEMLQVYKTGVEYHFYHALGLLVVGLLAKNIQSGLLLWSGWSMVIGTILFSFSLYLLSVTGVKWLGAITPLGGTAFIVAWVLLAIGVVKSA